jgi:hypothetical protein
VVSLGASQQEVSLSLKCLRDLESCRLCESFLLECDNKGVLDDVSTGVQMQKKF